MEPNILVLHVGKRGARTVDPSRPIDRELCDYTTTSGVDEIDDQAGRSPKQAALQALLDHGELPELRPPLPAHLDDAQQQGFANTRDLSSLRGG